MAPGRKPIFTDLVIDPSCIQAFEPERVLGEPEPNVVECVERVRWGPSKRIHFHRHSCDELLVFDIIQCQR